MQFQKMLLAFPKIFMAMQKSPHVSKNFLWWKRLGHEQEETMNAGDPIEQTRPTRQHI